jgi:hypothetical protein
MAVRIIPGKLVPESGTTAYMELQADTESDLNGLTKVGNYAIAFGSLCNVVGTGDIWALNSNGEWKNQTATD